MTPIQGYGLTIDEVLAGCTSVYDPEQRRQNLIALIEPGEVIHDFICPGSKTLVATEKRLLSIRLQREGVRQPRITWITAGYAYEDISAVQFIEGTNHGIAFVAVTYLGSDLRISEVADEARLRAFSQMLNNLIRGWKTKLKAAQPPDPDDLTTRLQSLYKLYQSGILDEGEYKTAKKKMIDE